MSADDATSDLSGSVLYAKRLLLLGIVAFFGFAVWNYWDPGAFARLRFDEAPIYLSVAGSLGLTLSLGVLWLFVLRRLFGRPLPLGVGFYVHLVAWLGRYTPGKLGLFLGKALLGQRLADARTATASIVYENALLITSGVVVAAVTVPVPGLHGIGNYDWLVRAAFVLTVLACLMAAPAGVFWIIDRIRERFPSRLKTLSRGGTLSSRETALLCVVYCIPHASAGLGFYALVCLVAPHSELGWLTAIGVLTAAHLAGIFAAFAPAGLGVREAALGGLLLPYMSPETAVSLAFLARLTSVFADLLVFVVVALLTPYARRSAELF